MSTRRGGYVYRGDPALVEANRRLMAERGGREPRWGRGDPSPCGTRAGYQRHRRAGERPCAACRNAESWAGRRAAAPR